MSRLELQAKSFRIVLMRRSWLRACGVVLVLLASPASAAMEDPTEIAVLLRDRVGRDADLRERALDAQERASLEDATGLALKPVRVASDGAQIFALPVAKDGAPLRALLADLRALPQVVYADRPITALPVAAPPGGSLDRIIIKLRDPATRDASDAGRALAQDVVRTLSRIARVPVFHERTVSGGAHALRLFQKMSDESVGEIAARLAADESVSYAAPTVRGRFGSLPNDALYPEQWPLFAAAGGIDAPTAWKRTRGNPRTVLAVLDSGVRTEHPDLAGRLLPGYDFVSDVRRSNDFDGRDGDASDPGDATMAAECAIGAAATVSTWHGTHVAGTMAASTNNRVGVAGVDWRARVLPVRVGAKCGIDPIDLIDAIRWASGALSPGAKIAGVSRNPATHARVLNLSMEFPGPCPRPLQEAIDDALLAGALVVVAAGNAGQAAGGFHPANCRGVVAVHANDAAGARASYSNYGDVDLSAPGGVTSMELRGGVLSTVVRGEKRPGEPAYEFRQGTSMAAPMVAGVAALVLAVDPGLTPGELHNVLEATARPFPVGTGADCTDRGPRSCGAGIVDAGAAVGAAWAMSGQRSQAPSSLDGRGPGGVHRSRE